MAESGTNLLLLYENSPSVLSSLVTSLSRSTSLEMVLPFWSLWVLCDTIG